MKPINILSIDFDYFVNATAEQRMTIFPDGHEHYGVNIYNTVWMARYGECPELENIGVVEDEYTSLINYLNLLIKRRQSSETCFVVTNSHKWIYDVITRDYTDWPINMLHVDFHSDNYGLKDETNCGNWVNWLEKSLKDTHQRIWRVSKITWLGREDSDTAEETRFFKTMKRGKKPLETVISDYFHNSVPDLIYICKSGSWSPPHLDVRFDELISLAHEFHYVRGSHTQFSLDVESRWTEEYQESLVTYKKQIEEFKKIKEFNKSYLLNRW